MDGLIVSAHFHLGCFDREGACESFDSGEVRWELLTRPPFNIFGKPVLAEYIYCLDHKFVMFLPLYGVQVKQLGSRQSKRSLPITRETRPISQGFISAHFAIDIMTGLGSI